jgi:hypothetical protein
VVFSGQQTLTGKFLNLMQHLFVVMDSLECSVSMA